MNAKRICKVTSTILNIYLIAGQLNKDTCCFPAAVLTRCGLLVRSVAKNAALRAQAEGYCASGEGSLTRHYVTSIADTLRRNGGLLETASVFCLIRRTPSAPQ